MSIPITIDDEDEQEIGKDEIWLVLKSLKNYIGTIGEEGSINVFTYEGMAGGLYYYDSELVIVEGFYDSENNKFSFPFHEIVSIEAGLENFDDFETIEQKEGSPFFELKIENDKLVGSLGGGGDITADAIDLLSMFSEYKNYEPDWDSLIKTRLMNVFLFLSSAISLEEDGITISDGVNPLTVTFDNWITKDDDDEFILLVADGLYSLAQNEDNLSFQANLDVSGLISLGLSNISLNFSCDTKTKELTFKDDKNTVEFLGDTKNLSEENLYSIVTLLTFGSPEYPEDPEYPNGEDYFILALVGLVKEGSNFYEAVYQGGGSTNPRFVVREENTNGEQDIVDYTINSDTQFYDLETREATYTLKDIKHKFDDPEFIIFESYVYVHFGSFTRTLKDGESFVGVPYITSYKNNNDYYFFVDVNGDYLGDYWVNSLGFRIPNFDPFTVPEIEATKFDFVGTWGGDGVFVEYPFSEEPGASVYDEHIIIVEKGATSATYIQRRFLEGLECFIVDAFGDNSRYFNYIEDYLEMMANTEWKLVGYVYDENRQVLETTTVIENIENAFEINEEEPWYMTFAEELYFSYDRYAKFND